MTKNMLEQTSAFRTNDRFRDHSFRQTARTRFGRCMACWLLWLIALTAHGTEGPVTGKVWAYRAPPASEIARSALFPKVEVRTAGVGDWSEVAVYDFESSFAGKAGIAAFGLSSAADVRVTWKGNATSAEVLPSYFKIPAAVSGSQITFTVDCPRNLILNVNGDIDHPLCLFANPIDPNPPAADDPSVDFYEAGKVHRYRKTDRKRIYIEGGAVVKNSEKINLGSGCSLDGYGMIYTDANVNPLISWNCENINVRGVIVYNFGPGLHKQGNWSYLAFATKRLTIDNVKFFNAYYGEDGIDPDGDCTDLTIRNCFFHLGDDGVAIKASSWQSQGNIPRDITIEQNVFWQDRYGSPIHIGDETWSTQTLSGLKIVDNYVVRALVDAKTFPKDALIRIQAAQGATVDGMVVDGLYVEHSDRPRLVYFDVTNHETNKGIGAIRNVMLRNIHVKGPWVPSELAGYDVDHPVENVTFEDLVHEGSSLTTPEEAKLILSPFVSKVALIGGPASARKTTTIDGPPPEASRAVRTQPIELDPSRFVLENAKLNKTSAGLELLADESAATSGQAIASVSAAEGIVTFRTVAAPAGERFQYPNLAIVVGQVEADQRITAFVDPNTGKASITQGTRAAALKKDEGAGPLYFAKGKRTLALTVDLAQKTIYFSVGAWEMKVPFAEGFKLARVDRIGFDSYRTGATFSDIRFGSTPSRQ